MCGITGYINTDNRPIENTAVISNMLIAQKHRGPDDSGIMAFSLKEQTAQEFSHQENQEMNLCSGPSQKGAHYHAVRKLLPIFY